jgi:hypothetical protein
VPANQRSWDYTVERLVVELPGAASLVIVRVVRQRIREREGQPSLSRRNLRNADICFADVRRLQFATWENSEPAKSSVGRVVFSLRLLFIAITITCIYFGTLQITKTWIVDDLLSDF